MDTKFEIIDENTVTVSEGGSHYILIDKVNGSWRAKAYFNGALQLSQKARTRLLLPRTITLKTLLSQRLTIYHL